MKKIVLSAITVLTLILHSNAQTVPVADGPLLDALLAKYPSCFTNNGGIWEMDTNCPDIVNEDSLTVIGNSTSIIYDLTPLPYFDNLKFLHLDSMGVSWMSLSTLPPTVEKFIYRNIGGSIHDTLQLPRQIRYLDASNNPTIAGHRHWPDSLRYLNCTNSEMTMIPGLPAFLDTLICPEQRGVAPAANLLSSLPPLPSTLKVLICGNNALTSLPILPSGLKYLDCMQQERNINPQDLELTLSTLPDLPASLEVLRARHNKLSDLPALPDGLKILDITQTRFFEDDLIVGGSSNVVHPGISQLPPLPSGLEILRCGWNNLTSLPPLPASLRELDISQNVRTHGQVIPTQGISDIGSELHSGLEYINVSFTPMTCLPRIPASVQTVVTEGSLINCLPNSSSYTAVPALPLCNATNNSNHCAAYPVISGTLFYDINSNGVRDAGENTRSNVEIQSLNGLSSFSNINGYFEITGDSGSNTINIIAPTPYASVPASASFDFTTFDTVVNGSYALQPTVSIDSLKLSIVPFSTPRPGFDMSYVIHYENVGTTAIASNIQIAYNATDLSFIDASITGVTSGAGVLTVPVINTTPGDRGSFGVDFVVNVAAALGDTLLTSVTASVNAGSASDSVYNIIQGSYDPNDKNATPVLSPEQVNDGAYIDYVVRFQNTGTDTAFNVVITDQLETQLDVSSFQMLEASHAAIVKRDNRLLTFEFLNIQLPDSNVNEPLSHGYIKFRVKPITTLVDGDVVTNSASIYFDYNAPVVTNSAFTSIVSPQVCFTISASTTDALCAQPNGSITVTVSGGTSPFSYALNNGTPQASPDFTALPAGTYAVIVSDATGCVDSVDVTINSSGNLLLNASSIPANCAGLNGTITVTPNSGTAPYSYSLDGGVPQASETFTGVAAGPHTVVVTDANGCSASVDITVTSGSGFIAAASSTASGCGLQNGSITVTPNGGVTPYTYTLNGGTPQASEIFTNVSPGTHIISIEDASGCVVSLPAVVDETPISATLTTTQSTCSAGGTIEITGSTGTAPFMYSIDGGTMQSTAIFDNLIAGSYVVLVQDANMCTYTETVIINASPGTVVPTVSITSGATSVCSGEPVTFTATATNGGANPQYEWTVNGSVAGTTAATLTINPTVNSDVSVQLTSDDPCASPTTANSNTLSVTVDPQQTPSITIAGNTSVDQGASTNITSSIVNGGTSPSYQWQDSTASHTWANITSATNASIDYIPQQTGDGLRAILTSTATCTSSSTVTSNALYFTVETTTTPRMRLYPNPVRSILTIENTNQAQWVSADILDDNGRKVTTFRNSSSATEVRMDVSMLMSGIYFIRLIDRYGKPEYFKFVKQ